MKTIRYTVDPKVEAPVDQGVKMVTEVCGLNMERASGVTDLRFLVSRSIPGAGRQQGNWIKLNPDRIKDNSSSYFVVTHEILHYLGFNHVDDPNSNMHPNANRYFSRIEVRELQKQYGSPAEMFYPYDKKLVGKQFRDFVRRRELLLEKRADAVELRLGHERVQFIQAQVLKNLELIKEYWAKWHALAKKWDGTRMAG